MKHFLVTAGLCLIGLLLPGQAWANFEVCNKTRHPIVLALAHSNGVEWISEGWWTIKPSSCAPVLTGMLRARYYYVHAIHDVVGGGWQGDRYFCVASRSFTISGRGDCKARGYEAVGFYEIDTGDAFQWTEELYVDPPADAGRCPPNKTQMPWPRASRSSRSIHLSPSSSCGLSSKARRTAPRAARSLP